MRLNRAKIQRITATTDRQDDIKRLRANSATSTHNLLNRDRMNEPGHTSRHHHDHRQISRVSNPKVDSIDISVISNGDRDLLVNPVVGISGPNELTKGKSIASVDSNIYNLLGTSPVFSIYGSEVDNKIRTLGGRGGGVDREDRRDRRDFFFEKTHQTMIHCDVLV